MPRRLLNQNRQQERQTQERLQSRISAAFERRVASEINNTMRAMLERWESSGHVRAQAEHQRRVYQMLVSDYTAAAETFAGRVMDTAKSAHGPKWRKASGEDLFERIVQEFLLVRGGQKIADDISETTKKQVMRLIAMGRAEGLGQQAIARQALERTSAISRARAGVIARTETHSAANFSQHEAAKETGMDMQQEWIAAVDGRERPEHGEADGQVVQMDAAFNVDGERLKYPGDPSGSAHNVINCRCATGFIVD